MIGGNQVEAIVTKVGKMYVTMKHENKNGRSVEIQC